MNAPIMHCVNLTDEQRKAAKPWAITALSAEIAFGLSMTALVVFLMMTRDSRPAIAGMWISTTWLVVRVVQQYCYAKMNLVANMPPVDGLYFSIRRISTVMMITIFVASGAWLAGEALGWW